MADKNDIYRRLGAGEITREQAKAELAALEGGAPAEPARPQAEQPTEKGYFDRAYEAVFGEQAAPKVAAPPVDRRARDTARDAATLERTIGQAGSARAQADEAKAKALGKDVVGVREAAREEVEAKYPVREGEAPEGLGEMFGRALAPRYQGDVYPVVKDEGQGYVAKTAQGTAATMYASGKNVLRTVADVGKLGVEALTPLRFEEPTQDDPEGDRVRLQRFGEGADVGRYLLQDAPGHLFAAATAPVYRDPDAWDVAPVTPRGAAQGAALVPVESPVGAAIRLVGGADEAVFVEAARRPMEWANLLPEREKAWRANAPTGLGYVADVLQTFNTGEGFGDLLSQHGQHVEPWIVQNFGQGAADWYKSNARSLGYAADYFLPFGSVYAAAGRTALTPIRARDLADATGVDLGTTTRAVAGEGLPSWITTAKITDVGDAVAKRVDERLAAGDVDLPPRLKADMADMLGVDADFKADEMDFTEAGGQKDVRRGTDLGDAFMEEADNPVAMGLDQMLAEALTNKAERARVVQLAKEAAKRRARASLGDDLLVTMEGTGGQPLLVSAKEYDAVLADVTRKARGLGFNVRDAAAGNLTAAQRARLYVELRAAGYDGPLPSDFVANPLPHKTGQAGEGMDPTPAELGPDLPSETPWRGGRASEFDLGNPEFDVAAYNRLVDHWVQKSAGKAAKARYATRAYSPVLNWLGRKAGVTDVSVPGWVASLSRVLSPNPALAEVPAALRDALEHRLRQGEQMAERVTRDIVEAGQSGEGLSAIFPHLGDLPDVAYLENLKAARSDVQADISAQQEAAGMAAEAKAKKRERDEALRQELNAGDQTARREFKRAQANLARLRREYETNRVSGRDAKVATEKGAVAALEAAKADAAKRLAREGAEATRSFDQDQSVVDARAALTAEGQRVEKFENKVLEILTEAIADPALLEEVASVMAANARVRRWRAKDAPAGAPNPAMKNGYRYETIEQDDGSVIGVVHPPDPKIAVASKKAIRAKVIKAMGAAHPRLADFKAAWTRFSDSTSRHQSYQTSFNEAVRALRSKLGRVNTAVADIRNPDFERVDPSTVTTPGAKALIDEAKATIAAELAAKNAAEAAEPPPPLPLDHPAVAKADEVKAAQRNLDRARQELADHDASLKKQQDAIAQAEARLEAAREAFDRHRAAIDSYLAAEEMERAKAQEGAVPVEDVHVEAERLATTSPTIRAMLDAALAERAGDEPLTPAKKARLEMQVLEEAISAERKRVVDLAQRIERSFAPEAKRIDSFPPDYADALVQAFVNIAEDDGKALVAQLQRRYGVDALDNVAGGLYRMAIDHRVDEWLADTAEWMVAYGLGTRFEGMDDRFVAAVHDALAGKGDVEMADGRYVLRTPDAYKQAAASLLTRWGISSVGARGSDPVGKLGKTGVVTAAPIARAVEAARNRAKMPSWAWSEQTQFGDTSKRGAIEQAAGRALTNWKTSKVIGYTGVRAPAFIFGNLVSMPFIMDASLGQRQTLGALGQYAKNPRFMASVLDMHTARAKPWEDPSFEGRTFVTQTGKLLSAATVVQIAERYSIDSSQPHVEFARDMYDEVLAALDQPTSLGPLGQLLKGFGARGRMVDAATALEIKAKDAGREINAYHEMIWEMVRAADSTARIGALVDALDRGLSPDQAARNARDSQLDYGQLNSFERFTVRRIVPFYAFLRRSFSAYAANPTAFTRHARILRNHEQQYGGDEERGWDPNPGRATLFRFRTPNGGEALFDTPVMPNAGLLEIAVALGGVMRSLATMERDPGPTSLVPNLDESVGKIVSQFGPGQTAVEFVSGKQGGTGRDLDPGTFAGRLPGWVANTPPLFFLFDAAFDMRPKVNDNPAFGPVGEIQWYASDPRYFRAFMDLSGIGSEMDTLSRYFAVSPLVTSPEARAYGMGAPMGIAAHRTAARPTQQQFAIDRAKQQREVEAEAADYKRLTPK